MLKKEEWVGLVVLLLFFTTFLYFTTPNFSNITGFAVADPIFEISLSKTKLTSNDTLEGSINVTFNGSVDSSTVIKVSFGDSETEFTLKKVLDLMNISYEESGPEFQVANPQSNKELTFSSAGSQKIAFKLPKGGLISDFKMTVKGSADNPATFPAFDVPDLTEKEEWRYFGDLLKFSGSWILPEDLDENKEEGAWFVNPGMYYCEKIELPYAKHYNVTAKFTKSDPGGNMQATILSFDGEYATGGGERCDFDPEPVIGDPVKWYDCVVEFGQAQTGTYLVCIYTDVECEHGEKCYEIAKDTTSSSSRFDCPIGEVDMFCTPHASKDYFIKADYGIYSQKLGKTVSWDEGATAQNINQSITEYLEECIEDDVGDCAVPVTVTSESEGELTLSALEIYYSIGSTSSYSDRFYDLIEAPGRLTSIEGVSLENATKGLAIDLKYFNLTAPSITEDMKTVYLQVRFTPGTSYSEPVKVYKAGVVPAEGVEETLKYAKETFTKISDEHPDFVSLFNIDVNTRQIDLYQGQLDAIKSSDKTLEEKEADIETLTTTVNEYLAVKPRSLSTTGQFKDIYIPEPADVEEVAMESPKEAYLYQENVEVEMAVTNYVLELFAGDTSEYAVVVKQVTPSESLKDIYIYEIIPKNVANDVTEITFEDENYEVVEKDPIVRYTYPSLSGSKKIIYGVKKSLPPDKIIGLKTIAMPQSPEEIVKKPYTCGDGKCTKPYEDEIVCPQDCGGGEIPWTLIIILVVVLTGGIAYINFYKGKGEFRKLVGRSPFKSPQDLTNIKNYIKTALDKGSTKQAIAKSLLSSGWNKKQIVYAFEDLKWDERRSFTINLAPGKKDNVRKLRTFIKKCLQLNIPQDRIRSALTQKGWTSQQVDEAFSKVGKPQEKKLETVQEEAKRQSYYFEKMEGFQEK